MPDYIEMVHRVAMAWLSIDTIMSGQMGGAWLRMSAHHRREATDPEPPPLVYPGRSLGQYRKAPTVFAIGLIAWGKQSSHS
jgi:hypothetical protein